MEHTKPENKKDDATFRKELMENFLKSDNQDETFAITVNKKDVDKLLNEIIDNQENQSGSRTDIFSILKKVKR